MYEGASNSSGSPAIPNYPSQPQESTEQHRNKDAPTQPGRAEGGTGLLGDRALWWAALALPRSPQPQNTSRAGDGVLPASLHFSRSRRWRWWRPPASQARTRDEGLSAGTSWSQARAQCCRAKLSLVGWFLFSGLLTSSGSCTNRHIAMPDIAKVICHLCFNFVRISLPPATDALVLIGKQVHANQNIVVLITRSNLLMSWVYYFLLIVRLWIHLTFLGGSASGSTLSHLHAPQLPSPLLPPTWCSHGDLCGHTRKQAGEPI